ncbi:hypothetical protein N0V93_001648 [Gnomoniopsis smithogilvyi]|uniref:Protein kinase domain-containing protein n=1 Tax=Gnomoniopsis smithogilvyi TaxID=1191159 RepID=A0A9W8Z206_9PEZI|nr:hypothetical protein N0V93_001648 [Gnomoniopsis smithogilvyi]
MAAFQPDPNAEWPPSQRRPLSDKQRERIQRSVDYFEAYRRGQVSKWNQEHQDGLRKPIYSQFPVPWRRLRPARWNDQPEDMPLLQPGTSRIRYQGFASNAAALQQEMERMRNDGIGLMNQLRPLGYRLEKVLGRGGFGIACLFKMTDVNGRTHTIVVKAATRPGAMKVERMNLSRVRLSGIAPDPLSVDREPTSEPARTELPGGEDLETIANVFNDHPDMIALEFMKHGDMHQMLKRIGDRDLRLRTDLLVHRSETWACQSVLVKKSL